MMFPAIPQLVQVKQVLFLIFRSGYIPVQAVCHTQRVEQDAVCVRAGIELMLRQAFTNMLGKTGTDQQDIICIFDNLRKRL